MCTEDGIVLCMSIHIVWLNGNNETYSSREIGLARDVMGNPSCSRYKKPPSRNNNLVMKPGHGCSFIRRRHLTQHGAFLFAKSVQGSTEKRRRAYVCKHESRLQHAVLELTHW